MTAVRDAWLTLLALVLLLPAVAGAKDPTVSAVPTVETFGTLPDGREVHRYTLAVPGGWRATVTDYGAILTGFVVPPREGSGGRAVDVVLGFDTLAGYVAKHPYFGAICGRVSNRIAGGRFTLDGRDYRLATNNGPNHLHGGTVGFDRKLWRATPRLSDRGPAVDLELVSPDGDEGYPGRLTARVTYTLVPGGELLVDMTATSDAPTVVNLVQHAYWNLAGHGSGTIADHELVVHADRYLPVDATSIPTGSFEAVAGTPFDYRPERQPRGRVAEALGKLPPGAAPGDPRGIDHGYVVRGWEPDGRLRPAAVLRDPASGRALEVFSDQPGVQVYMGNFLDGTLVGKEGAVYGPNAGICLETQTHPDSVHHPDWPSQRLEPGGTYRHAMRLVFTP